jgi:hypothetical protein
MSDIEQRIEDLEYAVGILLGESPKIDEHYEDRSLRELYDKSEDRKRERVRELQRKIQGDLRSINLAREELGSKAAVSKEQAFQALDLSRSVGISFEEALRRLDEAS